MARSKKAYSIYIFLIVVALTAAGIILYQRSKLESNFTQVELVMSLNELRALAYQEGIEEIELLNKIKSVGINSLAIHEDTLESLSLAGRIIYFSDKELTKLFFFLNSIDFFSRFSPQPGEIFILVKGEDDYLRIKENLERQWGRDKVIGLDLLPYKGLKVKGSEEKLSTLGLGFSEKDIELAKVMGFQVILRPGNLIKINKENIDFKFKEIGKAGDISGIIFEGEAVLGYPLKENLIYTAELLKKGGYPFGVIEFAGQKGIEVIAKEASELAVRVHSITKEEMDIIPEQKAIDRWIRAAKERNVRIFYLKPFTKNFPDLLEANLTYLEKIGKDLQAAGFTTGRASRFPAYSPQPTVLIFLLILGVMAGGITLLKKIFNLKNPHEYVLWSLGILLSLFFLFFQQEILLIKLMALGAALIFPTLAILANENYFLSGDGAMEKAVNTSPGNSTSSLLIIIKEALKGFLGIILITFMGALFIAALLSNNKFMLGLEQFSGIKLSYFLPLFLVLVVIWLKVNKGKFKIVENIRKPLLIEHLIIMVFFAVFLVVYISRSGNFSFIPVLGIEEKVRLFLEKTLVARPRNKEFLIGYPALFLAMSMNFLRVKEFKILIILIGTVGPVTLINTFCHIHTPFLFSLLRTFNGVWLGMLLGIVVITVFYYLVKIFRKKYGYEQT